MRIHNYITLAMIWIGAVVSVAVKVLLLCVLDFGFSLPFELLSPNYVGIRNYEYK